jgi:hypothetical protein
MTLAEIEEYLKEKVLPKTMYLDDGVNIVDCDKFVSGTIVMLKERTGNRNYMPYYEHLLKFVSKLREIEEKKLL